MGTTNTSAVGEALPNAVNHTQCIMTAGKAWGLGNELQGRGLRTWSWGHECQFPHVPSLPQFTVSQISELSGLATFISPGAGRRLVQKGELSLQSSEAWGQAWGLSHSPCPSPELGTALRRGLQMETS